MKKTLVTILALVFVLGIAGTALAAPANPFVDVPAKHWAYGAVAQLAKAGLVDGYGDGTFRGDRAMTRYEMAQVVAKAMARSDKADAQTKALIDKLAVEFAAELNNLGVRVAKLEANASSIKFSGDARIRWIRNDKADNADTKAGDRFNERLRINMAATLSDSVTFTGRLTAELTSREDTIKSSDNAYNFGIGYFTFKDVIGGLNVKFGRDVLNMGYGAWAGTDGSFDALQLVGGGKEVKGWLAFGDIQRKSMVSFKASDSSLQGVGDYKTATVAGEKAINVTAAQFTWDATKDFQLMGSAYYSDTKNYNYQIVGAGFKYAFNPDFTVTTFWSKNNKSGAARDIAAGTAGAPPIAENKNLLWAQLGFKGANYATPGSFGVFVQYKKIGNGAIDFGLPSVPVFEFMGADRFNACYGLKGFGYGFNYTFTKNVMLTAVSESLTSYEGSVKRPQWTYVRMEFLF